REAFEPPLDAGRSQGAWAGHAPTSLYPGTTGPGHHACWPCPRVHGFLVALANLGLDCRLETSPDHALIPGRRWAVVYADRAAHLGSTADHSAHDPLAFGHRDLSSSLRATPGGGGTTGEDDLRRAGSRSPGASCSGA